MENVRNRISEAIEALLKEGLYLMRELKKKDDSMMFNPSYETILNGGDTVIAVGEEHNLQELEEVLNV